MQPMDIKAIAILLIKILSPGLMSLAIALSVWELALGLDWTQLPSWFHGFVWYLRIAAAIHLLEALAAAVWVARRSQDESNPETLNPIRYGLYTFFVGTVALQELWQTRVSAEPASGETVSPMQQSKG